MSPEELQQNIALYYSKLPPSAQASFAKMAWLETLKIISQKFALNPKQIETLGSETTLVLLGIVHPDEYEKTLKETILLPKETLEVMFSEINDFILKPIRPELTLAFEENMNSEEGEEEEPEIVENLDPRLDKLPEEVEKVIDEINYQATLYNIAKEQNLNVEQISVLEKIVTNLIVGAIHANDFQDIVGDSIKITPEKVTLLVNNINEQILKKIRERLVALKDKPAVVVKTVDTIKPISVIPEQKTVTKTVDMIKPINSTTPVQNKMEEKKETAILNSHGIEILATQPSVSSGATVDKKAPVIDANPAEPMIIKKESIAVKPQPEILPEIEKLELPAKTEDKIIPTPIPKPTPQPTPTNTPIIEKPEQKKEEIHPILAQKLSNSFQIPTIKSQYLVNKTIENITETNTIPQKPSIPYPPKNDPYRLNPEE